MSIRKSAVLFGVALSMAAFMNGCSSDTKEGGSPADVAKVDEATCAVCHSTSVSKVTGDNIYNDYIASNHFLVPGAKAHYPDGIGCQGCHGGGAMHNGVGPIPYPDPDAAGKCFECHKNYLPAAHFRNMTAAADAFSSAMYVTTNYEKDCTACHDPHKANITQQHKDWAESGHGDVNGVAWATEDFKENASCIRCHTSTGYINYVGSNFTLPTSTFADASDKGREVLTCKACHTDYNFKNRVRSVGTYTAPYNIVNGVAMSPVTYPNSSTSNICFPCHTGRESGGAIGGFSGSVSSMTGAMDGKSFKNSHYLAAAEVFYGKAGFHYYTSMKKYNTGYNTGAAIGSWQHGRIGMIDPTTGLPAVSGAGTDGPCVVCHLGASEGNTRSHTWKPQEVWKVTNGCFGCHDDFAADGGVDVVIEEQKELFDRAMDYYQWSLEYNQVGNKTPIYYDAIYPYFHTSLPGVRGVNDYKQWTQGTADNNIGKSVMGAAFNFNLLTREGGAHVHNRGYARWLIFDSVQYMLTGTTTYSSRAVGSTPAVGGQTDINNLLPFTAYSTAVAAGTRPTNPASITALKGYLVRSSGGLYYRR